MAKKTKYFFDPHELTYKIVRWSWSRAALRVFGFLCASAVFGALIMLMSYTYFNSPKEVILNEELEEARLRLNLYEQSVDELSASLNKLEERDKEIYRVVFEAAPLPDSSENKEAYLAKYKAL